MPKFSNIKTQDLLSLIMALATLVSAIIGITASNNDDSSSSSLSSESTATSSK